MTETGRASPRNQWLILIGTAVGIGAVVGGTVAFFASRGDDLDPWWGLAFGVIFCLGMLLVGAVVLRRSAPTFDAMSGLDKAERKAVGRAVTHGEPVDDPRLAHAAVLLAEQQLSPFPGPEWLKNGIPLMAVGGVLLLIAALSWQLSSMLIGLGMISIGGYTRSSRDRVRQGLTANQRLLDA